ncbi:MAG: sigma-54 dependent transcriptional regulator [Pseudomonadota bacterium]
MLSHCNQTILLRNFQIFYYRIKNSSEIKYTNERIIILTGNNFEKGFGHLDGTSKPMQKIYKYILKYAPQDIPVFITGSTGTGKERCAQALHFYSKRKDKPFIAFNCAAHTKDMLPSALFGHVKGAFTGAFSNRPGAIEQAEGGTLFLDEICDMPTETQATLLRLAQDKTYQKLGSDKLLKADIRFISATNKNPQKQIYIDLFRQDLYYRLSAAKIHMPDLKDRENDIVDLTHSILDQLAEKEGRSIPDIPQNILSKLISYDWPGNVRELENVLKIALTNCEGSQITDDDLPETMNKLSSKDVNLYQSDFRHISMPLKAIEKNAILSVISQCGGDVVKAAAILDVAPSTIYRKKQQWDKE